MSPLPLQPPPPSPPPSPPRIAPTLVAPPLMATRELPSPFEASREGRPWPREEAASTLIVPEPQTIDDTQQLLAIRSILPGSSHTIFFGESGLL
eukprot:scaffold70322_cov42-Phaeocystis_antarctica.AAC.1